MNAIEGLDDPDLEANVHEVIARCYEAWGENDKVDAEYELAASFARAAENLDKLTVVRYNHACFKLAVADLPACLKLLDDVDDLVQRYGLRRFVVPAACLRMVASCLHGDLAARPAHLRRARRTPPAGIRRVVPRVRRIAADVVCGRLRHGRRAPDSRSQLGSMRSPTPTSASRSRSWARTRRPGATISPARRRTADTGLARLRDFYEISTHGWLAMIAMRVEADAAAIAPSLTSRADELADVWRTVVANTNAVFPLLQAYTAAIEYESARVHGHDEAARARAAAHAFSAIDYRYYETYFRWREANAALAEGDRRLATEALAQVRDAAARRGFGGLDAAAAALAREHQLHLGAGRTTVDGDVPLSPRGSKCSASSSGA